MFDYLVTRTGEVTLVFGQDMKFWGAISAGIIVKWLLSESPSSVKQGLGGIAAGVAVAFYGTDPLISHVESLTAESRDLVVILLTLSGEHLMTRFMSSGPAILPSILKSKG